MTLRRLLTVEDFRRAARRRLPRAVFETEIDKTLGLLGVPRVADLDRSALRAPRTPS